jgi:hypothetical protein
MDTAIMEKFKKQQSDIRNQQANLRDSRITFGEYSQEVFKSSNTLGKLEKEERDSGIEVDVALEASYNNQTLLVPEPNQRLYIPKEFGNFSQNILRKVVHELLEYKYFNLRILNVTVLVV